MFVSALTDPLLDTPAESASLYQEVGTLFASSGSVYTSDMRFFAEVFTRPALSNRVGTSVCLTVHSSPQFRSLCLIALHSVGVLSKDYLSLDRLS